MALFLFACILNILLQGVTVDQARIEAINKLADKLITQGHTDTRMVKEKRDSLNEK